MRDLLAPGRERVVIAVVAVVVAVFAAVALARLAGGREEPPAAPAGPGATSMAELLPVSDAEFQDALAVAAEHGRAIGTFDPAEPEDAYADRIAETADPQYADVIAAEGSAAREAAGRLSEWGRPTTGEAQAVEAVAVGAETITFELALRAEDAGTGGREPLELGAFHVSLYRAGGEWRVVGVTDTRDIASMQGEGRI
ncbi:hypothetical protein ACFOVU_19485 [Nocardiopsis sediminis]|uniref:Mce-associated membrane protein n=1 Tax=Nocardiopsis sediminis TaxID=1778267 RepID=A0ABV8FPN6_9ACTN